MYTASSNQRIEVLDLLRGFAIFGILLINIQSFALPSVAYLNPFALDLSIDQPWSLEAWIYYLGHILADQKFMAIFSMLYGAGIALIDNRMQDTALPYLLKRHFVLAIIGFMHGYFVWAGDILLSYAICGVIILPFRRFTYRALVLGALILFFVPVIITMATSYFLSYLPLHEMELLETEWAGSQQSIEQEVSLVTGSWTQIQEARIDALKSMYLDVFPYYSFWRTTALMLVGIALFKCGLFEGRLPRQVLIKIASVLSVFSLVIIVLGLSQNLRFDWSMQHTLFAGSLPNYFGSVMLGLAYICWLMAYKRVFKSSVRNALTMVGKTALSNYLLQSIICGFIFFGYGISRFNELNRLELLGVVLFVWCVQLFLTKVWLINYRVGPVEWLWRKAIRFGVCVKS